MQWGRDGKMSELDIAYKYGKVIRKKCSDSYWNEWKNFNTHWKDIKSREFDKLLKNPCFSGGNMAIVAQILENFKIPLFWQYDLAIENGQIILFWPFTATLDQVAKKAKVQVYQDVNLPNTPKLQKREATEDEIKARLEAIERYKEKYQVNIFSEQIEQAIAKDKAIKSHVPRHVTFEGEKVVRKPHSIFTTKGLRVWFDFIYPKENFIFKPLSILKGDKS